MLLSDVLGDRTVKIDHAKDLFKLWFKPEDKIAISGFRVGYQSKKPLTFTVSYEDFLDYTDDDLMTITYDGNTAMDLYFRLCPIKQDKEIKLRERGGEELNAYVPGVWADLDVKEGGFSSAQEIVDFLWSLKLLPTALVSSGTGGVHAYWKLTDGTIGSKELVERWWSYLDEEAGDRSIDKLKDVARVFRLPGSLRFPKEGEGSKASLVTLFHTSDATYTPEQITEVSEAAYTTKCVKRKRVVDADTTRRMSIDLRDIPDTDNVWKRLQVIAHLEDNINQEADWKDILLPHGWQLLAEQGDGNRVWARPGRNERSATTDYEGSCVMSLFSAAPETGLNDLLEAEVNLTKYRVMLRLEYRDDEQAMIDDYLRKI